MIQQVETLSRKTRKPSGLSSSGKKKNDLTTGPIRQKLFGMAVPMFFGILAIIFFNVIDTLYVGRLGATPLAAMGFTFPVVFIVMSLSMGIGIGTSSVVSRTIGQGDRKRVIRLTTDSLGLATVLVLMLAGIGLIVQRPLFRLIGADPSLLPLITDYMTIWLLGIGLLVIPMVGNSAIRATGDTKTPAVIMVIGGIVNAVLDPFLIFGIGPFPRLELRGAALATVISWVFTFGAAIYVLHRREHMLQWPIFSPSESFRSWRDILSVGAPAAGANMLIPLSTAVLTRMVAGFGNEAVAAFGVGGRLESLAMLGIMALSTALTPFVGQNVGAGMCERVRHSVFFSIRVAFGWGLGAWFLLVLFAESIAALFSTDPVVRNNIILFCLIVPPSYGLFGMSLVINSTFNAMNKAMRSAAIIFLRLFVFAIPLSWIGMTLFGLQGIFMGMMLANILIGVTAIFMIRRMLASIESQLTCSAEQETYPIIERFDAS